MQMLSAGGWPVYARKVVQEARLVLGYARNWHGHGTGQELSWCGCTQRRVCSKHSISCSSGNTFWFSRAIVHLDLQHSTRFRDQTLWALSIGCTNYHMLCGQIKPLKSVGAGCQSSLYSAWANIAGINPSSARLV